MNRSMRLPMMAIHTSRAGQIHRRAFVTSTLVGVVGLSLPDRVRGQTRVGNPDLAALAERRTFRLINRTASPLLDGPRRGVRLSEGEGEGVAFLPGIEFANGTVEIDIRGKDVAQRSFVGVAFHGDGSAGYDAIYFRPFNFRSADLVGRSHSVQYHSRPLYGWDKLRSEHPGEYERAVNPVPDPNQWFRARVEVSTGTVAVLVNEAAAPCLAVGLLGDHKRGLVGLWVGNNSGGDFANLTITPMG